jgi:cytochrome c oxidase assembly factor CtaG
LFDLALLDDAWHIAQHATFFASALLFWQAMAHAIRQPSGLGSAVFCLFATSLIAGLLGALMAFSDSPWYRPYQLMGMAPFGLTPTEDQQLAGLLMWIPGGMVHIGAALFIIARVLREQPATGAPRRS